MKYSEYSSFDIGSRNEQDLFAPRAEPEPSLWDRHVQMESVDRGFDYRTWKMLFSFAIVIIGILFFGWCSNSEQKPQKDQPGIVKILKPGDR